MEYKVTGIIPFQPILVQYTEADESGQSVEAEDMFFVSPESGALVPMFDQGEGPKDPASFGKAFQEGWKDMIAKTRRDAEEAQRSKIVTPRTGLRADGQPGIIL